MKKTEKTNYEKKKNWSSVMVYMAAVLKSGSQSFESFKARPDTTGSPITRCPAQKLQSRIQIQRHFLFRNIDVKEADKWAPSHLITKQRDFQLA